MVLLRNLQRQKTEQAVNLRVNILVWLLGLASLEHYGIFK